VLRLPHLLPLALTILGACSPSAPPRRPVERAAVEAVADEFAVGPFRFHLPPGFRAVHNARLEDLRPALDGLSADVPDALGVLAPLRSPNETVRLYEAERRRYRLLFRAAAPGPPPSLDDLQIEHKVWWQMGLEEGRFRSSDRVAQLVELAGHTAVHTTVRNVSRPGGLRVWDLVVGGRRHTIAILFADREDDNGGRIEGFLYSLRVEPGLGA